MNQLFGGKTPPMRYTIIVQEQGYLGAFQRILQPRDIQTLVFSQSDSGPFWMSNLQKEESQHDKQLGTATDVQLKIPEMMEVLSASAGLANTSGKSARQLKDLCAQHGIPTFKTVINSIEQN
jgi:hypothetical protein